MQALKRIVARLLREAADKIDSDNCEMSESEAVDIMNTLSHEAMSKAMACKYLNLSRSRFDELVRKRDLPPGKKRLGFKELVWYKDELNRRLKK